MGDLYWLTDEPMERLQPFFPKSHGKPWVDDRRRSGCLATVAATPTGSGTSPHQGIQPCIPGRTSRNDPVKYDKPRYRRRSRIEIMFGRLKGWRRVATRYDRCPIAFFSAVALAATIIFWLGSASPDPGLSGPLWTSCPVHYLAVPGLLSGLAPGAGLLPRWFGFGRG